MHIPDNFLSTPVWASLDAVAVPVVLLVSRQAQAKTDLNRLPLLGVMGAFVFAAQMINFPVGIGTSGHLVGGTLLACLLGPWPAMLVLTAILFIQALLFQDGGVLALGANVLNMAVAGVLAGYLPALALRYTRFRNTGVFLGGFCSVFLSGLLALSELLLSHVALSGTLRWVSLVVFAGNALMEGAITVSVLRAIERLQDSGVRQRSHPSDGSGSIRALLGALAVVLACGVVFFASARPDGIEHLARSLGVRWAGQAFYLSPFRDYQIVALGSNWLGRALAGLLGLSVVYLLCSVAGVLLARTRRSYSA